MCARLVDIYYKYVEIVPATTQDILTECHRIRYQAYCVDSQWEEASPDGLETDRYDDHSIHYLLRFRRTGNSAGTTRLVLPQLDNLEGSFPSQEICESRFRHLPLATTAEGSRIIIARFSRHEEFDSPSDARVIVPNIMLGLCAAYIQGGHNYNLTHFCCTLDDGFIRLLQKKSIYFDKIGKPTLIHGKNRQPCSIAATTLLMRCKKEQPEIWRVLTRGTVSKKFAVTEDGSRG